MGVNQGRFQCALCAYGQPLNPPGMDFFVQSQGSSNLSTHVLLWEEIDALTSKDKPQLAMSL